MASLMLLRGLRISLAPRPPLLLATRANNTAVMFHTATTLTRPGNYMKYKNRELKKRRPAREEKLKERERERFLKHWNMSGVSPDSPEGEAIVKDHLEKWAAKREKDFIRRAESKAMRLMEEKLEKEKKKNKGGLTEESLLLREAMAEASMTGWETMEEEDTMHQSER